MDALYCLVSGTGNRGREDCTIFAKTYEDDDEISTLNSCDYVFLSVIRNGGREGICIK